MATMPSPPGRFSITTAWPQSFCSLSAKSRAVRSTPEPGPRGRMNLTVRSGQACAGFCADAGVPHAPRMMNRPMAKDPTRVTARVPLSLAALERHAGPPANAAWHTRAGGARGAAALGGLRMKHAPGTGRKLETWSRRPGGRPGSPDSVFSLHHVEPPAAVTAIDD